MLTANLFLVVITYGIYTSKRPKRQLCILQLKYLFPAPFLLHPFNWQICSNGATVTFQALTMFLEPFSAFWYKLCQFDILP